MDKRRSQFGSNHWFGLECKPGEFAGRCITCEQKDTYRCIPCPRSKYTSKPNKLQCKDCPAGKFSMGKKFQGRSCGSYIRPTAQPTLSPTAITLFPTPTPTSSPTSPTAQPTAYPTYEMTRGDIVLASEDKRNSSHGSDFYYGLSCVKGQFAAKCVSCDFFQCHYCPKDKFTQQSNRLECKECPTGKVSDASYGVTCV
jgi:hypothetical protein